MTTPTSDKPAMPMRNYTNEQLRTYCYIISYAQWAKYERLRNSVYAYVISKQNMNVPDTVRQLDDNASNIVNLGVIINATKKVSEQCSSPPH